MKFVVICVLSLALGSCSAMTARGTPPALTLESRLGLDAAAKCIVDGWNQHFKNSLNPLTHKIEIIDPGKAYEVAPQQTITVGAEVYFARVVAAPPGSRIELYTGGTGTWTQALVPTVQNCR
jgi:hypothetical protein